MNNSETFDASDASDASIVPISIDAVDDELAVSVRPPRPPEEVEERIREAFRSYLEDQSVSLLCPEGEKPRFFCISLGPEGREQCGHVCLPE